MTIAIRRPIAVLAACAAVGALVTGCGAGPGGGDIGAAAVIGGTTIPLDVVQQNITNVLVDSADARKMQQQKPSTFPQIARTIVGLSVLHEATSQLAAKSGIKIDQAQVDQVYGPATAAGKGLGLSQTADVQAKGPLLRDYIGDEMVWSKLGAKQVKTALATVDYAQVADRNAAQALVNKVVAHPEDDKKLFSATAGAAVDAAATPAGVPKDLVLLFAANAGEVVAFPMQSENAWAVIYVKKRVDNAGDTTGGQDTSQLAETFGQLEAFRFAQQAGLTLNPRFGVWEPLLGQISPSDGESSTISAPVRNPKS
ncbi:hypothetical protein [Kutzneria sp. 744]|uniref:hypothetical protein n=1 Tax=Kutzneria sp. (strain 744) TaxID=345341 RepID=UPI0004B53C46|nr:hypothetical protein [Kutzneria sp. 744]